MTVGDTHGLMKANCMHYYLSLPLSLAISLHMQIDRRAMHQPNGTLLGRGVGIGTLAFLVRPGVEHHTIGVELLSCRIREIELEMGVLTGLLDQILGG